MTDDFAAVDDGDAARLVAMMRATDAWPAVQRARAWVVERAALPPGGVVLDAGSGPGTFGRLAAGRGAFTVDLDRSVAMLDAARRAHARSRGVCGSLDRLPIHTGAVALARAERVLQWAVDPDGALAELARVTAAGGLLAVTDTDWGSFRIGDDAALAARWRDAALGWVPHPRIAADLPHRLGRLRCDQMEVRRDVVAITEWDPDDGEHADGPPGLPLRSIADGADAGDRVALLADVARLAEAARHSRFRAELTLVTAIGRIGDGP